MSAITSTDEFVDHTTAIALEERREAREALHALGHLLVPDRTIAGIASLAGFIIYWLGSSTRAQTVDVPPEGNDPSSALLPFHAR